MIKNSIKTITGIHPDEIPDSVFESQEPIILKGLIKNWPLTQLGLTDKKLAIKQLIEHNTQKNAAVYFGHPGQGHRLGYNSDCSALNFEIKNAPLNQVLAELLQHYDDPNYPVRYIASNILQIHFPQIHEQNQLSFDYPYFAQQPLQNNELLAGIWIGNKTLSPCHWDAQSNIACCVVGKRKFTLFAPDQVENLYPGPLDLTPGGQAITMVDFDQPDLQKYPKFAQAMEQGFTGEVEAGDAIYIPCMWWHQVESLDNFNVLINYWWNQHPKIRGQAMPALLHALLSIRDRPEAEKQAWKHLFDYYIFNDDQLAGEHLPDSAKGNLGAIDNIAARKLRALLLNKLNR